MSRDPRLAACPRHRTVAGRLRREEGRQVGFAAGAAAEVSPLATGARAAAGEPDVGLVDGTTAPNDAPRSGSSTIRGSPTGPRPESRPWPPAPGRPQPWRGRGSGDRTRVTLRMSDRAGAVAGVAAGEPDVTLVDAAAAPNNSPRPGSSTIRGSPSGSRPESRPWPTVPGRPQPWRGCGSGNRARVTLRMPDRAEPVAGVAAGKPNVTLVDAAAAPNNSPRPGSSTIRGSPSGSRPGSHPWPPAPGRPQPWRGRGSGDRARVTLRMPDRAEAVAGVAAGEPNVTLVDGAAAPSDPRRPGRASGGGTRGPGSGRCRNSSGPGSARRCRRVPPPRGGPASRGAAAVLTGLPTGASVPWRPTRPHPFGPVPFAPPW
ncbi:hypothetical protein SAMN05216252_107235 [Actinacidiphila glaucinigra]|uniref:Uncharacterized protein n=1 Tax=Actinacidiphila glaucinigra TaxID=235986 RepID=A0A239G4K4_9ACTN|nr:hypothetical protein SAMN05216252_107235 [Actinacidiphila glaucinigra]